MASNFISRTPKPSVLRRSPRFNAQDRDSEGVVLRRSPRFLPQKDCSQSQDAESLLTGASGEVQSSIVRRRSPRFLLQNDSSQFESHRTRYGGKGVSSLGASIRSLPHDSSKLHEYSLGSISNDSCESSERRRKTGESITAKRRSPGTKVDLEGFSVPRRSPRLSNSSTVGTIPKLSEKASLSDKGSSTSKRTSCQPVKYSKLDDCSGGIKIRRRSPRLSTQETLINGKSSSESDTSPNVQKAGVSLDLHGTAPEKCEKRAGSSDPRVPDIGKDREMKTDGSEKVSVGIKRKPDEGGPGISVGWTLEQEAALRRAYYAAKPTPRFWKKVSKMVPGKSAQECFDKVHSEQSTPPQPRPRSRAKKTESFMTEHLPLSPSKLLKLDGPNVKRHSFNGPKNHLLLKTMRDLLQKNSQVDAGCEADLFSELEPTAATCTQDMQGGVLLATPNQSQGKYAFLQKCRENSSGGKRSLSRFSSSVTMAFISPPVLKPVKNKVLHEKYIYQLRCREAKRKSASTLPTGEENVNVNVVKAAKNALVSEARDAICHFQHLQASAVNTSLNFDDDYDGDNCDDDSNEDEN